MKTRNGLFADSPDNSDCKQFVAGELLDLAIKPLELGPPKFEQCLKRDYSSPTCGTCSSGKAWQR